MTPEKFSEWLAAFSQTLNGAPNDTEWQQIKEVLASVEVPPKLHRYPAGDWMNVNLSIPVSC